MKFESKTKLIIMKCYRNVGKNEQEHTNSWGEEKHKFYKRNGYRIREINEKWKKPKNWEKV